MSEQFEVEFQSGVPVVIPCQATDIAHAVTEHMGVKAKRYRRAWQDVAVQLEAATHRAERAEAMVDTLSLAIRALSQKV